MTPLEWAAIITAISTAILTALGLFGAAIRYIVSLILDAYKRQAEATIAAKDRDLAAKDQTIDRQDQALAAKDAEIARLQHGVAATLDEVRQDVRVLRQGLGT